MNFIIRWIVTAISVAAAVWLVPGIEILSNSASWAGHRVLRTHSVAHQHVHQADSADPLAAGDRAHPGHLLSRGEHASALHRRVARQRAVGAGFYIASFGSALWPPSSSRWCPPSSTASSATTRSLSCSPRRLRQPVAREGILPGTPACSDIFRPRATGLFLRQAYQKTLTRRFSEKEKVK